MLSSATGVKLVTSTESERIVEWLMAVAQYHFRVVAHNHVVERLVLQWEVTHHKVQSFVWQVGNIVNRILLIDDLGQAAVVLTLRRSIRVTMTQVNDFQNHSVEYSRRPLHAKS